jgi:hypothetical protein
MRGRAKRDELIRLQRAFETEAAQFHDLSLSILYLTQELPPSDRIFRSPNHVVMLWQHYGQLEDPSIAERLVADLRASNIRLAGIRGSQYSCFAIVEGPRVKHFIRMAMRAGSIFSENESRRIETRASRDFASNLPGTKHIFVSNRNPAAVWLNFVLHHLGKTHPRYLPEVKVDLDPFAASLSAIDKLLKRGPTSSKGAITDKIKWPHFRVALSFPGERREYVAEVASILRGKMGDGAVFYDIDYQSQLARPNLDILLQQIYRHNSDLIVVFLCDDYVHKEWCGLEWRAIRDLLKERQEDRIMLLRFDNVSVPGLFGIDGYINIGEWSASETARAIIARVQSMGVDQ